MSAAVDLAVQLADEIEQFPLGQCGPSDDPDMAYAYTAGFRDLAKRFVAAVRRIGDPDLSEMVQSLDTSPRGIVEAHDLRAELVPVCDALKEATQNPSYGATAAANGAFLSPELLIQLKSISPVRLDPRKLIRMCEELNDAYARANHISGLLLVRAIMNHVPPAFGCERFSEVVARAGRSVKAILERLERDVRPLADLQTHMLMRASDALPTKNQLEPFKAGFEVLIQELVISLSPEPAQGTPKGAL